MDMDDEFAMKFVTAVKSKLEKIGYIPFLKRYGPGYLLVSIHYPFFDSESMELVEQKWAEVAVKDLGCFRSIYITFRVFKGYKVVRWKVI